MQQSIYTTYNDPEPKNSRSANQLSSINSPQAFSILQNRLTQSNQTPTPLTKSPLYFTATLKLIPQPSRTFLHPKFKKAQQSIHSMCLTTIKQNKSNDLRSHTKKKKYRNYGMQIGSWKSRKLKIKRKLIRNKIIKTKIKDRREQN